VTRATDPHEIATLAHVASASAEVKEWNRTLADLAVDEVALLPGPEESRGRLRRIRLVERLTPHVRHRTKYLDVPVAEYHAFAFSCEGRMTGQVARTLKEFLDILAKTAPECFDMDLHRGDFSKWIAEVFGDRHLAATLRHLEENYRLRRISNINDAIAGAVRKRYEFVQPDL
jgi:hypothetical protein